MPESVLDRLLKRLAQAGVPYRVLHHEPVHTSEEAAQIRGTPLRSGAKALVVKAGEQFVLMVLPADRKLDGRLARKALGVKGTRFASRDEVEALTGLRPGSIPPFGSLFGLSTYCDPSMADEPFLNFNAGDHAVSIQMTPADYRAVEQPILVTIAEMPS